MSTLLTSLPGDIPGLLRRWSPVVQDWSIDEGPSFQIRGVVVEDVTEANDPDQRWLCWFEDRRVGRDNRAAMFLRLDLTDPTGRAHAAWWVRAAIRWPESDQDEEILTCAEKGSDMTPTQIDTLARLVLRLAGR